MFSLGSSSHRKVGSAVTYRRSRPVVTATGQSNRPRTRSESFFNSVIRVRPLGMFLRSAFLGLSEETFASPDR